MNSEAELQRLIESLKNTPPKIIGGYKKPGWAIKALEKTSNESTEAENNMITAKSVLEANDGTYYPAFLVLDMNNKGQLAGAYFLAEEEDQFSLIPYEIAKEFIQKKESELTPFKYRTLEKIEGDEYQKNWPDFS
ncbi:hypothetical protein [Bacillus sp. CECT 9360]|uniref:hypothetical protein n=1 Tax=Bacillus sp. CECT 9360 TaxID=2845821 RepID=UPI001E33D132|nr:hypothetical protein [Bacillus sp. CECT 9360]CAH0345162.1 hypothetical protein BCI9360_01441 [Bacillus sp. CECT 9360]